MRVRHRPTSSLTRSLRSVPGRLAVDATLTTRATDQTTGPQFGAFGTPRHDDAESPPRQPETLGRSVGCWTGILFIFLRSGGVRYIDRWLTGGSGRRGAGETRQLTRAAAKPPRSLAYSTPPLLVVDEFEGQLGTGFCRSRARCGSSSAQLIPRLLRGGGWPADGLSGRDALRWALAVEDPDSRWTSVPSHRYLWSRRLATGTGRSRAPCGRPAAWPGTCSSWESGASTRSAPVPRLVVDFQWHPAGRRIRRAVSWITNITG